MRYTGLTSLLGMLLALPGFAFGVTKQATWFGGHTTPTSVLTSAQSHRVTSNGVTKVQLRHLYKDDWLVTDVVGGGDWGEGIVSNMHRVSMGVSSNAFAIEDLEVASRVADARLDGLELRADLIGPAITNVLNAIPVRAPYNSYTSFSERVPALRISSGDGIGFFVLCTDGVYRDLRYTTPGSASHRYNSLFDISSLYGHEFSVSYLTNRFGNLGWTASLVPSADNVDKRLSEVCGGASYPKCYGREATVRELLFDVLVRDPSLLSHSGFDGHGRDFVDLKGLSDAMGYNDVYARMAHLAAAQLRHDYDSGPVAGLVLTNANVRLSASGMSCSLAIRGGVLYNAEIPESVSTVKLSVIPKQDVFGPRSESYRAMLRFNGDATLYLDVPEGSRNTGPGTRRVTRGYRLVTVTRSAEYNGVYWYSMRLEELDNVTMPDFTSANKQLVSTVDSRLSVTNDAFVSAVESVNGKYLPLSGGTMAGDVTFEANGITLGSGGWIFGGGIATAGAGYQKHNLYHHWYYNRDYSSTEDPKFEIAVKGDISATNPNFSNEVLKVGLNIDTNSVAVLQAVSDTFGGFPVRGTATTVGGLLAALAAAVAWLNKNKADKSELNKLAEKFDTANSALEEVV